MTILDKLADSKVLIFDGAMGTFLQAEGLKPGECPESWNISHPDVIRKIAKAYIDAGSNIIETNSFGGTVHKLADFGLGSQEARSYNIAAAKLAKEAAGNSAFVAASVGPTGQIAEDEGGDLSEEDFYNAFKEQIIALAEGGADAICIETMSSVIEAVQAVRAAKENTNLPVICTFTFEPGARGYRTMMGATPAIAAQDAIDAGADIVGANCGTGIQDMVEIIREIREAVGDTPILAQANAGVPVLESGVTVFKDTPEQMAASVKELMAAGANIIGGCCGTTPEHISEIAKAARKDDCGCGCCDIN